MKLIYLKPALKCDSFDVAIGIKIPFFRVLVTIELGHSLLQFVTTNCLIIEGRSAGSVSGMEAIIFADFASGFSSDN